MNNELISKLCDLHDLSDEELGCLINERTPEDAKRLAAEASELRDRVYGKKVFMRGLIEFTSYCRNDCLYCGLRRSNHNAQRYRLTKEEILSCAENGYMLGFRTFVLQGGEDPYFTDDVLCDIVSSLKEIYPDCAVTLSVGERSLGSYKQLYYAGADRYLLRHETADADHYGILHPKELKLSHRMECLSDLKSIGYQTGCGFMVGSPYQSTESIVKDLRFIKSFSPEMVGIGPFIPHCDTPYRNQKAGTLEFTLFLLSIVRLMLPDVLLPATTALGTIAENGRELGIMAGANVVMPNLSPNDVRKKYSLYDNKLCSGDEAAENVNELRRRIESTGYKLVTDRGDHIRFSK
ncbi:MAG: [Oscillospiraceae bacterium]|nr:[FeFe] hydrogenase H-cluster radical SAM maturase HydE [Oscillospiraceae bacterium]